MAQVRNLLVHVCVERAQRHRVCHRKRDAHRIEKGQSCLVVADANGGAKNYCAICASDLLKRARGTLAALAGELGLARE
jgi:hypothetical protein